jgi:hypothetical protein
LRDSQTVGYTNRTLAHGSGANLTIEYEHTPGNRAPADLEDKAMSSVVSQEPGVTSQRAAARANALAERLEKGARDLATFASTLTDAEWKSPLPRDGRKIGVVVHHVANIYPLEIQVAQTVAGGNPVEGVTWDDVHAINAGHAKEHDGVTREVALALLQTNSAAAAAAIRALSDEELDRAAPVSLYGGAPLTCQFVLEDHAVRHSYHHLARIRAAVKR